MLRTDLYAALEKLRCWVPQHRDAVIFRKWTTVCGRRLYAEDYAYGAWPLTIRRRASSERVKPPDHFGPIESASQLKGGFKAGERIHHRYWGSGTIVSIDERKTIFDFDVSGLVVTDTPKAHYLLSGCTQPR